MSTFDDYRNRYRHIKFERKDRILQVSIHHEGGPSKWTSGPDGVHAELGDAFFQIGRDPENLVVILTGTGDRFVTETWPPEAPAGIGTTAYWNRIYKEGKDLIHNLLDIDIPVIGAVNGPAYIHAELLTMSDLVIASDTARFADKVHFPSNTVPGDGVHVWWLMLLGPNRGRQFLMTGMEIDAQEAKSLGFVAEVVPHDKLLARAWDVARDLTKKSESVLRYTRISFTQHIKRRMLDDLGYGLQMEGLGIMSLIHK